MKYRYLSIILILLIVSIGAVSAQENSTSDDIVGVEQDNEVLSASEYVIDDSNYATYFNETSGIILENSNISDGDTIKLGNVNNKDFVLDKLLTVTSNSSSDVLTNVSFYFIEGSDYSTISDLNIVNNNAFDEHAISVIEASNIVISDNIINVVSVENPKILYAICALYADNLNIQANTIDYVGKTNGTRFNSAIAAFYSENVSVKENILDISIPSADVDWSSGGEAITTGLRFKDCNGLEFIENNIKLITEASVGSYPTVYAIDIKKSDDVVVSKNYVTAESSGVNSSYLYVLSIQGDNFDISSNDFEVTSDTNYVCGVDVEGASSGIVDNNYIIAYSPFVAYGIYACDWNYDGQVVNYTNNDIIGNSYAVYGMELFFGQESTIDCNYMVLHGNYTTGITEKMTVATIINNDIYAYGTSNDIGESGDYYSPAMTIGILSLGESQIHNNAITSTGNWTIQNSGSDVEITGNYLVSSELLGDDSVDDISSEATVFNNIPIAGETNYDLTNDTFFLFFDNYGRLRENITAESLTFIGEFSDLTSSITIDRPIQLLGDDAILHDMSFEIVSDNVTVEDFTFISDSLSEIISIVSSNDVSIRSSEFTVQGVDDGNNAVIHIFDSDNVTIDLNIINFIVETNDTYENRAIFAEGSNDLIIVNSDICAYLPSRSIDWATGTVYSEGVFLDDCNNAILDDNTIAVMSNDKIGDYDSIYAVHVIGDNASIVYSRIAAAEAPYGYALVITGENFKIDDNYLAAGENSTYACGIDVESNSNGNITDNEIVVIGESAYGIYTANWAGDVKANITNNIINATGNTVFGMSLSGSEALVEANSILTQGNYTTGVASAVDNIAINDNEIIANGSNVGTPAGYDTMGIETIGVNIVSGNATVTNNKINATNKYAVDFDGEGQVTDNEIYADVLTGDFAVDYSQEDNVLVENNTPEMELDYKLTNDTFYIYFDEEGVIREQIDADNLTFIGEFSNLVDVIIINKPIHVLGDNATLNNISMAIVAENVVVDGFNFTGERSGLIILYSGNVQVKNNNFNINGSNNDSNAVIGILDSENVTLENNTIIFGVETNDTFLNTAVDVKDSDNLIMTGNTITALLPARSVNWTTGDVYSQGVFLNGCNNAVLENNTVGVKSNDQIGEYDTIYAVNINGDNATVIGNILGAVEAPYGYALVIAGENFNITNNMIVAGENGTYACGIDVESNSNGVIDSNLIYAVANESAYGIYTANWAGDVKANITNNIILSNASSPFGLSLSGSEALVENNSILVQGNYTTGIASAVDNIVINNNTIIANASNEGTPAGYDTMGIETTGIHIVSGSAKVTDNDVTTTGEFTVDLDGTGQVTDNQLVADVYTGDASVDYTPDQRTIVQNNTPAMQRAVISAEDVVMYYKNGTRYVIVLTDQEGIPLANKSVTLTINGASYNRTTDENGTASLAINLNSGNYTASALFVGESGYSNATAEINITVLSTVFGDDIVKMFKNGTQYYATFLDGQGNPLADGTEVTFNINGVMYKRYVNGSEGKAKLNINLVPGVYVITAINPVNGEMHANNITVLATIEGNDLVKYYKNESQYVVTVYGADGKAVGAGETVTFNINGVFYTRQTNASGQAKLNINLQPGNYTITADYNGAKISNNIEVKPVLSAKDLVKKYGTSDQFIAYLVDGQGKAYSGQTINFNINGVFYKRVTDSDGRGTLNIKLGAAKDVYIITSSYNGSSISNTITIVD